MLLPILQEWGYDYQVLDCEDGSYEIPIWQRKQDASTSTSKPETA